MTEQYRPEVGHHVRIVIEGPVAGADHMSFDLGNSNFWRNVAKENVDGATVTYERLPDPLPELPTLPTTVGSTVLVERRVYALTSGGWHRATHGTSIDVEDLAKLVRDADIPSKITEAAE